MNKLTPYNSKAILSNIELVLKTDDITKLNKPTYNFINLMSGFIAHYDLYGFQDYYSDVSQLARELRGAVEPSKRPDEEYQASQYGAEYARSKFEVFEGLPAIIDKYTNELENRANNNATLALEKIHTAIGHVLESGDKALIRDTCRKLRISY